MNLEHLFDPYQDSIQDYRPCFIPICKNIVDSRPNFISMNDNIINSRSCFNPHCQSIKDFKPYFDPDYENLKAKINPPQVVIDNSTSNETTLVKVDSVNTDGALFEIVQVLSEFNLSINKAYISSDEGWFLDVFYVTDSNQKKVTDKIITEKIVQSIVDVLSTLLIEQVKRREAWTSVTTPRGWKGVADSGANHAAIQFPGTVAKSAAKRPAIAFEVTGRGSKRAARHTAIELTGGDRHGLLYDIFRVLSEVRCNVNQAEIWTHNKRVAGVVYVIDECTGGPLKDLDKQGRIRELLDKVMKGNDDSRGATIAFSTDLSNTDRRLHQMMFIDQDYDTGNVQPQPRDSNAGQPIITVQMCKEKGYSIVDVKSVDRPKLLFDTVCTLTEMQYAVFHASINSENGSANQVFYIRHRDGQCIESESEENRVIKCLQAAIERRVSIGVKLELCTSDRAGLLSDVTRTFRENGLSVARADVETHDEKAVNVFYVTDAFGNSVDKKRVDDVRRAMQVGTTTLDVTEIGPFSLPSCNEPVRGGSGSSVGSYLLSSVGWLRSAYCNEPVRGGSGSSVGNYLLSSVGWLRSG